MDPSPSSLPPEPDWKGSSPCSNSPQASCPQLAVPEKWVRVPMLSPISCGDVVGLPRFLVLVFSSVLRKH